MSEVAKTEEKPQQREKKENRGGDRKEKREGGDRKDNKDRKDNRDRKNRDENGEKKDRKPREPREDKFNWDKAQITLETVIPALPKQKERIQKPDENKMDKAQAALEKQILALFDKKKNFIQNLRAQGKEQKDSQVQGSSALRGVLKEQQEKRKELEEIFENVKTEHNKVKDSIETIFEQTQKIRQNMKFCMKKPDLEELLKEKRFELNNGHLNGAQESKLIKDIDALEKSLPLANKLYPLEEKMKSLNDEKKITGSKMFNALNDLKKQRDQVKATIGDLDELKSKNTEDKETLEPIIQQKKDEIQTEIDALREEKRKVYKEYKDQMRQYYDEQDQIRHIEWQKRIQDKLKRDADYQKRQAEKAARQAQYEEEQKKIQDVEDSKNPYQADLDNCEYLITLVNIEIQKNKTEEQKEADISAKTEVNLNSDQWKKEKVTMIATKKGQGADDDFLNGTKGKKGKGKKISKKQEEETSNPKVQIGFSDLNIFSSVKVSPPIYVKDLQKTLELVEEKKKYFEELPKPEKSEEKKEDVPEKKEKRGKKNKVVIDDDEQYPGL